MHASMVMNVVHLQLLGLVWFLLQSHAVAIALASLPVSATSVQRLGCPNKCGDVDIPFPFGIGDECALPGFTISCNDSFSPSKPYYSNIEIKDISLEKGEIRMYTFAAYVCYNSINTTFDDSRTSAGVNFTGDSPFLVAQTSNEFTAIGCETVALLQGRDDGSFLTGCITTCASLETAAKDGEPCTGLGCCQLPSIPANLTSIDVGWGDVSNNRAWSYSPCKYAFVAEKGWYDFSREDFSRNGSKSFVYSDGEHNVPTVVDWAIRNNGSCSSAKTAPACVSNNSYCIAATNGEGYLCNCSAGYAGNPYVTGNDGCTNVNECELTPAHPGLYHCYRGSRCQDTDGDYECKCPKFHRGDGKINDNLKGCHPIISTAKIATVATFVTCAALATLVWYILKEHKRRQRSRLFDKNGGKTLKKLMDIKFFTEKELNKMTENYKHVLGKGAFGEVYKGTTNDKQQVAVKRGIKRDMKKQDNKDDNEEEMTNHSRIRHVNLVRLVGCCLETETPVLVMEFIPKGNLHHMLHGSNQYSHSISLQARLRIAIGCAEALAYMHSDHDEHKSVVHGDIKSANILLDDNSEPKVADFGSAKLKSIANFGIVLLELITRKEALYNVNKSLPLEFVKSHKHNKTRTMYFLSPDDALLEPSISMGCLDRMAAIAVQCVKEDVDERPTMAKIADDLKKLKEAIISS
ncbi:hypothetical protein GUJ93_ZPchr0011g27365 [Zizania palustris]|uniref:Protein kinase domain-containing protein n=1 Tax=Zizania palustris TaxID=103762 RepID=A0A8J5WKX8_ZIZPA|nr:hypothetical protein GUJ93_ZPchr0011g27365 [Zizania palustris]